METLIQRAKGVVGMIGPVELQVNSLVENTGCSAEDAFLACAAATILVRAEVDRKLFRTG